MTTCSPAECSGRLFWTSLFVVLTVSSGLFFYKLGDWPWDHDEVPSLMEMGLLDSAGTQQQFGNQIERLPKLVPVWYTVQRLILNVLPPNELGTRVFPALCGVLSVVVAFICGWRWRGPPFAYALALLMALSQCFVWSAQENRFYSLAILFLTLTLAAIWNGDQFKVSTAFCAGLFSLLTVLSHNLLVVVFGIGLIAAIICRALGAVSNAVLARCGIAAGVALAVYLFYLRPIMQNWVSGGASNALVSYLAQCGMPTIALAALGTGLSLRRRLGSTELLWWTTVAVGELLFVILSPLLIGSWGPRYALLFLPALWVLGAYAMEQVAFSLSGRWFQVAWYACVAILLLPKLASHYQDGSRHDFRSAAAMVDRLAKSGDAVYCNFAETLGYYLKNQKIGRVKYWPSSKREAPAPSESFLVAFSSNAFDPLLSEPRRRCDVLGEFTTRRFDEQSHVVRLYRFGPEEPTANR